MPSLKTRYIAAICLAIALIVAWTMFGFTAVRVVLGMLLLFFVPSYIILRNFRLDSDERLFFSFFIGLGVFPVIAYYLNRLISSLRISILVTFVLLVLIGIGLSFLKKKSTA